MKKKGKVKKKEIILEKKRVVTKIFKEVVDDNEECKCNGKDEH